MTEQEQALARRLGNLERKAKKHEDAISTLFDASLESMREDHAMLRVLLAVTALAARHAPDPLKFADEVRTLALNPLTHAELADTRERIELILSKVEGSLNRPKS